MPKLFVVGMDKLRAQLSIRRFEQSVRAAVRGLWSGTFSSARFAEEMALAVDNGYERAWREGAAACGIQPGDRTPEEQQELWVLVANTLTHLPGFMAFVDANSQAKGGRLGPCLRRASLWVHDYKAVVARARSMSCANQKLEWVLGRTEEHCSSCLRYAGIVKRASVWEAADVRPQSRRLACGGWNCDCSLVVTNKPGTPGRLPAP